MPGRRNRKHTVLHFCCDRDVLTLREWSLSEVGYCVLNVSNGFEAIKLSTSKQVDAVVLDLDHNHAEVALIAQEIKRNRPEIPTIVLAEATVPADGVRELADAMVPKDDPKTLVESLEKVLEPLKEDSGAVA